ncbi:methionine--tRNA ligase [Salinarchaeum laminariae]|uniref:methionine--tRNA ligase n=1 Tax=Salinarchaeum laminariae TaxID=869888 RepID=UPI0020BFCA90|nr:methionine--tRNA ligase [Salinarchaeum laminariae]
MSSQDFPTEETAVVTCGLPYANGDLHVGHLRGYTAADAFNRALERIGQETAYVSGSDMHGTPVAVNAWQEGVSPEEFSLEWHEQYAETFPKFDVDFDNYGHTHDETNTELTREIVRELEAEGFVEERTIEVAWDPEEDQALPDRYVEGTCPYCGEQARGDECDEGCGRHLEPGEIEDPVSTVTGNPAEYREREHKFFTVSKLADFLTEFLDDLDGTDNARNQPRQWIEEGLQDWCITRDMDWGIDYPGEHSSEDDLVLYVWVDAPIEYIASTKQYSERVGADVYDWEDAWNGSEQSDSENAGEIVHFIGRDIIQHHTIFWPAMLHVAGYDTPRAVCATGFITINGKGLSTSRNRAIWAQEYLDEGFHPDLLRYYLTTNGGLQQDIDFSWEKFADRVNGELVGTLGNFAYRGMLFAFRNYDGTPEATVSEEVEAEIEDAIDSVHAAVNEYDVRAIGTAPVELARFGNEYIQRNEPWSLVDDEPEAAAQVIYDCVQLSKACAVLAEPVMPGTAEELWTQLGEDGSVHDVELEAALEPPADEFEEPTELFEGVEDERVEELDAKLADRVASAADGEDESNVDESDDAADGDSAADTDATDEDAESADDVPADLDPVLEDRIGFEEFQDLDLRVGRIETAEGIEGADELVKLTVDIGVEVRQIVAGLKQLHDVDELPGTKVVVMANLEAAELFGVESDGMVLAAGEQADLLTTYEDAVPGERVR